MPSSSDIAAPAQRILGFNSPSVGRPRCEVTITAAPAFRRAGIRGTKARMRVSSVMFRRLLWTFQIAGMITRLPRK